MRVLMFGWEFPPYMTGGLGTACYGLSQSLAPRVDKLVFVLPRAPGAKPAGKVEVLGATDVRVPDRQLPQVAREIVEFLPIDSPLTPYQNETTYHRDVTQLAHAGGTEAAAAPTSGGEFANLYGGNLVAEVQRFGRLASRAVHMQDFDVIHAHDWLTFPAAILAKRASGLPLVVHVHATEFDRAGDQIDQRVYDLERAGMEAADRIVAVSRRTKDMIVARYGIPAEKVTVIHNGVMPLNETPAKKVRAPGEQVVTFLGRITMQKGPEYFLEAAYLVAKALPSSRFVMAGTGDMMPRMVERMADLGLMSRFHFTGFVNEAWRNELFSQTDVFVLSSISEPFGITPVEAMQHGIPVVLTKQSGVSEVVAGAIKVDFWDVRRMADAIINILEHAPLRRELIKGGGRDLEALTWDRAATLVTQVYQEIT